MMSTAATSLQQRQKLHRRQQSTPVAFEATQISIPANNGTVQRPNSHRRGQSFDMSRSPIRRQHQQTKGSTVSMHTNIGSTISGQQILREAQQQRLARPGQHHADTQPMPQCGIFQPSNSPVLESPYDMTMNAVNRFPQHTTAHSQFNYSELPMSMGAGLPIEFGLDENNQHIHPHQRFQQNMGDMPGMDRRMSQPDLHVYTGMRPYTPVQQIQNARFPLTPVSLSHNSQPEFQYTRPGRSPTVHHLQDDTIRSPRPVSMQKSRSLQGIVEHEEPRDFSNGFNVVPPPPMSVSFTELAEPVKQKTVLSNVATHGKSALMSSTPVNSGYLFGEVTEDGCKVEERPVPILTALQPCQSPTRPALSPRRMSISDLNLEPGINASIEETNVTLDDIAQFIEGPDSKDGKWVCVYEDCNKRFGRKENIKSHVQTHLGDRQFRCDHCKKCFVRGHDLKRHAKIHTGTKAYTCLCGNAFARHDALTRHRQRGMCIGAFEGVVRKEIKRGRPRKHRPEMDDRVDKADRVRRRNAERDQQGADIKDLYTSSASSCSFSSWGSPPTETMDNLSIHDGRPEPHSPMYDNGMALFDISGSNMHMNMDSIMNNLEMNAINHTITLPSDMFSFTPPASPGYSTGNKPSPNYRELTPAELEFVGLPEPGSQHHHATTSQRSVNPNVASSAMSFQASQHSLPSLSHSSSPPPTTDNLAFDFSEEPTANVRVTSTGTVVNSNSATNSTSASSTNVEGITVTDPLRMSTASNMSLNTAMNMGMGMGMGMNFNLNSSGMNFKSDLERNDFDSFLDYAGGMDSMGLDANSNDSFFTNL